MWVSTVVNAEYEYNGLHWRTIKRLPPNSPYGISSEGGSATVGILRKMYYSAAWQLLEEQIDTDYTGSPGTDRTCQQVWGAPALRLDGGRYVRHVWDRIKLGGSLCAVAAPFEKIHVS